ncbi:SDR family oxidoreductase [Pediococcus acidilactici]|uniref:SDR family oxidoreductase n=1 Tax=Pediococcus acidilactici TaxID=1254 RepID=UPI0019523F86|nr:SDR family oxidoreductase [Pediococcus acidilactici]MBM6585392.1 SDR family oxidoreductase [Pediococcus acidilactici]
MAKIFIAGGSGRVATALIKNLVADGNEVVAGARHPENVVEMAHVNAVKLDLHDGVDAIADLMKGSDVVYFTAGSRGADLLQTDAMGAVKTMQAAEKLGIKRYVMLSSLYTLESERKWHEGGLADLLDYTTAKFFADNYLVHDTDLDYTIVQPTSLTEEAGTGQIYIGKELPQKTNPIPDVAKVLADVLKHPNTVKKVFMMSSGSQVIDQALANV